MKSRAAKPQLASEISVHCASGIPVHCRHDTLAAAEDLQLYPGNYRKHPAAQLDRMHKVISGNGWRRSAVVSRLSGYVTKGNGMVQMAKRHGLEVPVEYQDYRSRAEEIRDLVADNRLAALATDDEDALAKLLGELEASQIEFAAVTGDEFERMLQEAEVPEAEFPITSKLHESYDYVVVFTENATDFVFLQTLCGVRPERSYKKTGIGLGRAVPFERFLKSVRENRHSIDVQGDDHDDTPTRAKRGRVRS